MRGTLALVIAGCAVTATEPYAGSGVALAPSTASENVIVPDGTDLANSRAVFTGSKRGHVAFLGGSITEMEGYRPRVMALLRERFAETEFTFTNAGIASTCSTTGAFRLREDVLDEGPVDLLFVEFAVNDDQDAGHAARECIRGLEGIVRQTRRHNPRSDIVVVYFVNEAILASLREGEVPLSVEAHEEVATHYRLPVVHVARETARRIDRGELTWETYGGVHPGPGGHALAEDLVRDLFQRAFVERPGVPADRELPDALDAGSYSRGRFVDLGFAQPGVGWSIGRPDGWETDATVRPRFRDAELLWADAVGARFELEFEGRTVGAYVLAGPGAGVVTCRVDGGPPSTIDLFHRFSRRLHYPRTVIFATDLEDGPHVLSLEVSNESTSGGHEVRILEIVAD